MPPSRALRIFIGAIYVSGQVVLGSHAEANVWAERRRAKAPVQLAAVPMGAMPDMPARSLLSGALAGSAVRPGRSADPVVSALTRSPLTLRALPGGRPDIVLFQDVHLNPEAQRNIAAGVAALSKAGVLAAVGFEGAFGPMRAGNLFPRRALSSIDRVARAYLESGRLAAPSYAALNPALKNIPFVGVDDRERHAANVRAYLDSLRVAPDLERELAAWRQRVEAARADLPASLRSLEEARDAHRTGRLPLGDFIRRLGSLGPLPPSLRSFSEAYELEKSLDFSRVEQERRTVLARLAGTLSDAEARGLLEASLACRAGDMSFAVFYARLETLCREKRLSLDSTPAFRSYVRYVMLADRIDAARLLSDLENHSFSSAMRLAATEVDRHAVRAAERLGLSEKLRTFALTPAEWEAYDHRRAEPLGAFEGLRALPLKTQEAFYREADARSDLMAENISALRRSGGDGTVAFVTGGFHSDRIVAALSKRGLKSLVVTPQLTKVDLASGSAYLSAFAREKTPLDRLFAGEKLFVAPLDVNLTHAPLAREMSTAVAAVDAAGQPVPVADGVVATTADSAPRGMTSVGELPGGVKLYRKAVGGVLVAILPVALSFASAGAIHFLGFSPIGADLTRAVAAGVGLAAGWLILLAIGRGKQADAAPGSFRPYRLAVASSIWPLMGVAEMMWDAGGAYGIGALAVMLAVLVVALWRYARALDSSDQPIMVLGTPSSWRLFAGLVGTALLSNLVAALYLTSWVTYHATPQFSLTSYLYFGGFALAVLLASQFVRVPFFFLLLLGGGIANMLEVLVWGGVMDPLEGAKGNPNIADVMIFSGVVLSFMDMASFVLQGRARPLKEVAGRIFRPVSGGGLRRSAWGAWIALLVIAGLIGSGARMGALPVVRSHLAPGQKTPFIMPSTIGRLSGDTAVDLLALEHAIRLRMWDAPAAERVWAQYAEQPEAVLALLDAMEKDRPLNIKAKQMAQNADNRSSEDGGGVIDAPGGFEDMQFPKYLVRFRFRMEIAAAMRRGDAGAEVLTKAAPILAENPDLLKLVVAMLTERWADPSVREGDLKAVSINTLQALGRLTDPRASVLRSAASEEAARRMAVYPVEMGGLWRGLSAKRGDLLTPRLRELADLITRELVRLETLPPGNVRSYRLPAELLERAAEMAELERIARAQEAPLEERFRTGQIGLAVVFGSREWSSPRDLLDYARYWNQLREDVALFERVRTAPTVKDVLVILNSSRVPEDAVRAVMGKMTPAQYDIMMRTEEDIRILYSITERDSYPEPLRAAAQRRLQQLGNPPRPELQRAPGEGGARLTLAVTRRAAVWLARALRLDPDGRFFRVIFPSIVESPIHYFKWFVRLHATQSREQYTRGLVLIRGTAFRYLRGTIPFALHVVVSALVFIMLDSSLTMTLLTLLLGILSMASAFWLGGVRGHMRYLDFIEQTRAEKERPVLPIVARNGDAPLQADDLRRMADILRSRLPYRLRVRVSDEVAYQAVVASLSDDMRRQFSDFARGRFDGTVDDELLIMDEAGVVAGLTLCSASDLDQLFRPWMPSGSGFSRDDFLALLAQLRAGRPARMPGDGVVEDTVTGSLVPLARRAARRLVASRMVADAAELGALTAEVRRTLPTDLQDLLSAFPHRLSLAMAAMAAPTLYDDTLTLARMLTRPPVSWDEVALRSLMAISAGGGISEADAERVLAHIRAVMLISGYASPQPERVTYSDFTMQVGPEVRAPHLEPLITRLVEGDMHPEDFATALHLPGTFRDGRAVLRRLAAVSGGRFARMANDGLRRLELGIGREAARLAFNPDVWAGLYDHMSSDGRLMAHVDGRDMVHVWNTRTGEIVRSLRLGGNVAGATLGMSPDGRRLVIRQQISARPLVWDLVTDRVLWRSTIDEDERAGRGVQPRFNSDGTRLIDAPWGNRVRMVNLETGESLKSPILSSQVKVAIFARGTGAAYLGLENGSVVRWDFSAGTLQEIVPERFRSAVGAIAEDADSGLLYIGTERRLEAWESDGGGISERSPERGVPVSELHFDAEQGRLMVSRRFDVVGEIWDVKEWETVSEFVEPTGARLSPDGQWALVRRLAYMVSLFRRSDGLLANDLDFARPISGRPFSGDGTRFALSENSPTIRIISSEDGNEVARVGLGAGLPLAYRLSDDGSRLFVVESAGILRMWNVDQEMSGPWVQISSLVTTLDWNQTPGLVAVGTTDGRIEVRRDGSLDLVAEHQFPDNNIPEGVDLGEFSWVRSLHPGHVISLAVRPDGGAVLFATRHGGIGEFNLRDRTVRLIFDDVDGNGARVGYSREGYPLIEQRGLVRIFNHDLTPRHLVPADIFPLDLMRGRTLEPFLAVATEPGVLTNALTHRFARWFLPLIGVTYTPRRAELWVSWWFELITLQSLLPIIFPLFLHDNRDALGRWSWDKAVPRLIGHGVMLAVMAMPFMLFPDAEIWVNVIAGLGLHMLVHFLNNLFTRGPAVRPMARALAAAVAAGRAGRSIPAETLIAAAPEARPLDINAVAGGASALEPMLTALGTAVQDREFAAEWRAALSDYGVTGAVDVSDAQRAVQAAMTAASSARLDAGVLPGRERYFVTPGRDETRFRALIGTLAPGAKAAFLVQPGDESYYTALAAGNPAIRVVPALSPDEDAGALSLSALESRLGERGMSLSNGLLVVPDNMAVSLEGLSDEVRRALVVLLVNDVLAAVALRTADLETVVRISRVMAVQA